MGEIAQVFRVGLYGIQKKDRNVLKRIFAITQDRSHAYSLIDSSNEEQADILIVNADNVDAREEWNTKNNTVNGNTMCATVLASHNKLDDEKYFSTFLPFYPTRLLKSLDMASVERLNRAAINSYEETQEIIPENLLTESSISSNEMQLSNQELETFVSNDPSVNKSNKKQNVLVVDDSRPVRKALDTKLRLMDYEVQHAASGREALWLLQNRRFDSVFLDVVMPGIDGYEVCRQIKNSRATKHIPVIMLTSMSSQFDKVKGKLAGCDTYLTKPIEHDKFEKVVAGFLM